ncbi:MAG TPA: AAA family ATPase [Bacteroidales bacterium]|nr:AAA family ATPase [Bacteroidales bacterium]
MFDPNTFFEMEERVPVSDHSLWVERYRPRNFEDFIGNSTLKETLKMWVEKKDIPHLLLYSSPGTGKTSLGKMIVDLIPCDYLIINASDENGVDSIRDKVQEFCMTMGMRNLKVMFLDEADRLTPDAQGILRNLMETYSHSTRFILTCNYKDKITPAIWSRCQTFEVRPPSKSEVAKHLVGILKKEEIQYQTEDVVFIVNSYFPDLRKIINYTQQSSIEGELKIARASAAEQDYKTKLVELLKEARTRTRVFDEIRQLVADASFSNYDEVYRYLFDHINEYSPQEKVPMVILNLAESIYQSALVFEREITFVAAMHKLLTILK